MSVVKGATVNWKPILWLENWYQKRFVAKEDTSFMSLARVHIVLGLEMLLHAYPNPYLFISATNQLKTYPWPKLANKTGSPRRINTLNLQGFKHFLYTFLEGGWGWWPAVRPSSSNRRWSASLSQPNRFAEGSPLGSPHPGGLWLMMEDYLLVQLDSLFLMVHFSFSELLEEINLDNLPQGGPGHPCQMRKRVHCMSCWGALGLPPTWVWRGKSAPQQHLSWHHAPGIYMYTHLLIPSNLD